MWSLSKFNPFRKVRLWLIARKVRQGKVPQGVPVEKVFEALRETAPKNFMEAFGLLTCRVFDKHGNLKQDCGLVGVREVTDEFVEHLADAMMDSSVAMDNFHAHAMGDGSTAETQTQTALVNQVDGRNLGSQTHGATSNIYKSVATITAGSAYTAIEHGIFDTTGAGSDVMLDRTIVASPPTLATDDEVEWTYNLTISPGG